MGGEAFRGSSVRVRPGSIQAGWLKRETASAVSSRESFPMNPAPHYTAQSIKDIHTHINTWARKDKAANNRVQMVLFHVETSGSSSYLKVLMKAGETIQNESDALVSKTDTVALEARMEGGVFGALGRAFLHQESVFLQHLTCGQASGRAIHFNGTQYDGECLVANHCKGDLAVVRVSHERPVLISKGAFLCAEDTVQTSTARQGLWKGATSGAGWFLMRAGGLGQVVVAAEGACVVYDLRDGEMRSVDNGHLLCWEERVRYEVGMATSSIWGSVASGEGMMAHFTGPGRVWIQTHKRIVKSNGQGEAVATETNPVICLAILACMLIVFLTISLLIGLGIVFVGGAESGGVAGAGATNIRWGEL